MATIYTPHFAQFFDDNGTPLAGGKLYTYAAGTTTPKATYTTAAGDTECANPIILDSAGRATFFIDGSYKFTLHTAADVLVKTTDNITAYTTLTVEGSALATYIAANINDIILDGSLSPAKFSGRSHTVTVVASSSTFTRPAGLYALHVIGVGGGGGGGGSNGDSTHFGAGGGGGAGGAFGQWYTSAELGASADIVIGGAGLAGTSSGIGGTGGNTTFTATGTNTTTITAYGGEGGGVGPTGSTISSQSTGGAAGYEANATLPHGAQRGARGIFLDGNGAVGGDGGASLFGLGGAGGIAWSPSGTAAGAAGTGYGAGGGGGANSGGGAAAGAAGAAGLVVLVAYISG